MQVNTIRYHLGRRTWNICTFPLDNRNIAKQIQSFMNERLPCLIHPALYKTRATVICLYRYILLNKFSCLLQNLRMIFFLVSHFKGTINKVENDEMFCIFLWKNGKTYFERFRKLTVQNEQLIYTICAIFLSWGI